MEHLKIWIQILTILIGTRVIFYTTRKEDGRHSPYILHLPGIYWMLNAGHLFNLLSKYLLVNFFHDLNEYKASLFGEVVEPFSSIFFIWLVFFLTRLSMTATNRDSSRWPKIIAVTFSTVILTRTLIVLFIPVSNSVENGLFALQLGVSVLSFAALLICLFRLAFQKDVGELALFGRFYLAGTAAILISAMTAGPRHNLIYIGLMLLFNLFPFFWFPRFSAKHQPTAFPDTDLQEMFQSHGISARQGEIITLLMEGLSNREIAQRLFIAPHTVKNHIYMIYRKLGVKNRVELVNRWTGHER